MTFARTLLERLQSPEGGPGGSIVDDLRTVMTSIQQNLQLLLNSRRDQAPSCPDYGTSDFSQFFVDNLAIEGFKREIHEAIEHYEPRLVDVLVEFLPSDDVFRVHFKIEACVIGDDGERLPVLFRTILKDGQLEVLH